MRNGNIDPPSPDKLEMSRIHAVIPAAGHSKRMGQPKLLLRWQGGTVVRCLLDRLLEADLESVSILTRQEDRTLQSHLMDYASQLTDERRHRLALYQADPPPEEMRDSIERLLQEVNSASEPSAGDAWMLVPADIVALQPATVQTLVDEWRRRPDGVLVPTYEQQRGHPTIFSWQLAAEVARIPRDQGVNWLLARPMTGIRSLPVDDPAVLADLDTPEDYRRWSMG